MKRILGVLVTFGVLSILVLPAFARVAAIETAVPLADDSESAMDAAVVEALTTVVQRRPGHGSLPYPAHARRHRRARGGDPHSGHRHGGDRRASRPRLARRVVSPELGRRTLEFGRRIEPAGGAAVTDRMSADRKWRHGMRKDVRLLALALVRSAIGRVRTLRGVACEGFTEQMLAAAGFRAEAADTPASSQLESMRR